MSKKIPKIILCTFFLLGMVTSLTAEEKVISFDAGLSTGIPVYGDKNIRLMNSDFVTDGHRIIMGTVADIKFRISKNLYFIAGNDTTFDFCWNENGYSNHMETAFYPGLKVYPGIGGLNFSCAYSAGTRWDFLSSDEDFDKAFWGNGFRLCTEYDFSLNSKYALPSIGFYYRCCPRGSYHYDNIISLYLVMPF